MPEKKQHQVFVAHCEIVKGLILQTNQMIRIAWIGKIMKIL